MKQIKYLFLLALALPILLISGKIAFHEYSIAQGQKIKLKITGYDPRDLLSGHYISFRVDFQNKSNCKEFKLPYDRQQYVCLEIDAHGVGKATKYTTELDETCPIHIKGLCKYRNFDTGLDKYFVPEHKAKPLEQLIRKNQTLIEVSLTSSGEVFLTNLIVEQDDLSKEIDNSEQINNSNFEF